jgi:hypothetical protein
MASIGGRFDGLTKALVHPERRARFTRFPAGKCGLRDAGASAHLGDAKTGRFGLSLDLMGGHYVHHAGRLRALMHAGKEHSCNGDDRDGRRRGHS